MTRGGGPGIHPDRSRDSADRASARLRATYDRVAPLYDLLDLPFEWGRYRALRPKVFAAVAGARRLLDCGVGTGRNLPFYPPDAEVTGIDLCPGMLARARRRATKLGRDVELIEANVLDMPFADGAFSAATATFLFCVLPDEVQEPALREIARVVKPGGAIVLLEYSLSGKPWQRRMMKLWAPWVRFAYGAAFDRRTTEHVRNAGLAIADRRFVYSDIIVQLEVRTPEAMKVAGDRDISAGAPHAR